MSSSSATVLSFDPGAYRMGYAVLQGDGLATPKYIDSGVLGYERGDMLYQKYRLLLVEKWASQAGLLLDAFRPDEVVSEIVPTRGFNDASQSILAMTAITTVQVVACLYGYKCDQIGATTVKAQIGGSNKATKVKVRNGVFDQLPELMPRLKDWKKVFDESDAIAIGLTHLGYSNKVV